MAPWTCRFRPQNLITIAILNVFTSVGILCVPVPMLWKLKIPLRKKLVTALSLSSAIIVICSAITRASVTFGMAPSAANLNRWGVRETVLCTLAVNVPIIRLLFTRAFWKLGSYRPEDQPNTTYRKSNMSKGISMQTYEVAVRNSVDSKENIMDRAGGDKDVVVVQTTMIIEHHERDDEEMGAGSVRPADWTALRGPSMIRDGFYDSR